LDRYLLKCKDISEPIGALYVDFDNDKFNIDINERYDGPLPGFILHVDAPMPINERIKLWILERAPEPNYEFIDALIEKAGLVEYDAYGFFKYNNGQFITDKYYVELQEEVIMLNG